MTYGLIDWELHWWKSEDKIGLFHCMNESISLSSSKSYTRDEIGYVKEVTEIIVYWFVCLNTFKIAKSKNGLFEILCIYM